MVKPSIRGRARAAFNYFKFKGLTALTRKAVENNARALQNQPFQSHDSTKYSSLKALAIQTARDKAAVKKEKRTLHASSIRNQKRIAEARTALAVLHTLGVKPDRKQRKDLRTAERHNQKLADEALVHGAVELAFASPKTIARLERMRKLKK